MISEDVYNKFELQASELVDSYTSQIKELINNIQVKYQELIVSDVKSGTVHCVDDLEKVSLAFMDRLGTCAFQVYESSLSDFSECYKMYVPNGELQEAPLMNLNLEVYIDSIKEARKDIPRAEVKEEKKVNTSSMFLSAIDYKKFLFGNLSEQAQNYSIYKDAVEQVVNHACMQVRGKLQRYVQKVKITYEQLAYAECISK